MWHEIIDMMPGTRSGVNMWNDIIERTTYREDINSNKIKVKLKNGKIGTLVKDVHIKFDNDKYSYTVPVGDIEDIVKEEVNKNEN